MLQQCSKYILSTFRARLALLLNFMYRRERRDGGEARGMRKGRRERGSRENRDREKREQKGIEMTI